MRSEEALRAKRAASERALSEAQIEWNKFGYIPVHMATTIRDRSKRIYISPNYADFKIKTADGELMVHSIIIASNSTAFEAAISFHKKQDSVAMAEFDLSKENPTVVSIVIDSFYGRAPIFNTPNLWLEAVTLAHFLGIRYIADIVDATVMGHPTYADVIALSLHLQLPSLVTAKSVLPIVSASAILAMEIEYKDLMWIIAAISNSWLMPDGKKKATLLATLVTAGIANADSAEQTQQLLLQVNAATFTPKQIQTILAAKLDPTTRHLLRCLKPALP